MLRQLEASHDHIVGYSLAGDVTDEEYRQAASELRDAIARFGKVRVLFRLSDLSIQSFFAALDERFQFVQEHGSDVERVAIVSDETGAGLLSKVGGGLSQVETRHFGRDEEQQAWAWLE